MEICALKVCAEHLLRLLKQELAACGTVSQSGDPVGVRHEF